VENMNMIIDDDYNTIKAKIEHSIEYNKLHPDYQDKVNSYKERVKEFVILDFEKTHAK
jgi:hypothetical protein